jgi:phthalate 4,5-dioxygenase
VERRVTPPGVDPVHHRVRSAAVVLTQDQSFEDATRDVLVVQPGMAPASV